MNQSTVPKAAIALQDDTPLTFYAATELQRYLMHLFGTPAAISRQSGFDAETYFLLTVEPGPNRTQSFPSSDEQAFALQRTTYRGKPALSVCGGSARALLWAVYELVEHYGVTYLTSGDVYPDGEKAFHLPAEDVVRSPRFDFRAWRGINVFAMGPESWGLREYRAHLDQLAKLKFNAYVLNMFTHHPFVHYRLGGRDRSTGDILHAWRMPIEEPYVGRDLFSRCSGSPTASWNMHTPVDFRPSSPFLSPKYPVSSAHRSTASQATTGVHLRIPPIPTCSQTWQRYSKRR